MPCRLPVVGHHCRISSEQGHNRPSHRALGRLRPASAPHRVDQSASVSNCLLVETRQNRSKLEWLSTDQETRSLQSRVRLVIVYACLQRSAESSMPRWRAATGGVRGLSSDGACGGDGGPRLTALEAVPVTRCSRVGCPLPSAERTRQPVVV